MFSGVFLFFSEELRLINTGKMRFTALSLNGMALSLIVAEYFGNLPRTESSESASVTMVFDFTIFGFSFAAFFGCIYSLWRLYHVSTNSTSDVVSAEEGMIEVEGEIEPSGRTLTAPISGEECVAYEYQGTQTQHMINSTYSSVVEFGREGIPFYVDDGTGRVLVDPEGAEIAVDEVEAETVDAESSDYYRDTTFEERHVPAEGSVYVFGPVEWSKEHGELTIQDGGLPILGSALFFKISNSSESELIDEYEKEAATRAVGSFVGIPLGLWLLLRVSGVI